MDVNDVQQIAAQVKSGLLAAFGGVIGYLADVVHRDKPFSWLGYLVFVATAFFIGEVLDSWLPASLPGKGGVLMVAGTAAYPILTLMQAKVTDLIEKWK